VTLTELDAQLQARGVKLALQLIVRGRQSALTAELVSAMAAHRAALLVHVAKEAQWAELAPLRWGPAVGDSEPGIVVDR
jgi:hypothetical protein